MACILRSLSLAARNSPPKCGGWYQKPTKNRPNRPHFIAFDGGSSKRRVPLSCPDSERARVSIAVDRWQVSVASGVFADAQVAAAAAVVVAAAAAAVAVAVAAAVAAVAAAAAAEKDAAATAAESTLAACPVAAEA
jgi:hypothetical protein